MRAEMAVTSALAPKAVDTAALFDSPRFTHTSAMRVASTGGATAQRTARSGGRSVVLTVRGGAGAWLGGRGAHRAPSFSASRLATT